MMFSVKKTYFYLFILFFYYCSNSQNNFFFELEKFDNSLDSLINEPMFDSAKYLVLYGDILKNNPKKIEELVM